MRVMNMKVVIGIAVGVVLLVVAVVFAIPDPAKKALRQEETALQGVSSWRIRTQISRNGRPKLQRAYMAVCPDKEHVLEENMGDFAEYIRIGDDEYYRKNSYTWVQGSPGPDLLTPLPTPRPCLSNPGEPSSRPPAGAEEMRLALEMDIKEGQIHKGEVKPNSGSPCREWSITRMTQLNRLGSYTACLSETTNLPMYIRAMNDDFSMSFQWNPAVTIEAPDLNSRGDAPKWE
jgi:hypothetical protein